MTIVNLLAPVPLEHLIEGVEVCEREGKVAFGSRAWEVFRELDTERNGKPVDVYIYASDDLTSHGLYVSWHGRYIGHVNGNFGAHPEGMRFRPQSTAKYPSDNKGHWAVFWEIDQLRELNPHDRIPIYAFGGYKSGTLYKKGFIPKGPLIVARQT